MIADTTLAQSGGRSLVAARPLKRGKACMNCRFLKIKCDGLKPICGPCQRAPRDDECEYADGPTRSRTKALEVTVQRLEARLHELEHPDESTPSVTLYDPYSSLTTQPESFPVGLSGYGSLPPTPFGSTLPRPSLPGTPDSRLAPLTPVSSTSSFGYPGHGRGASLSPSPLGIFDSQRVVADSSSSPMYGLDLNDPHVCEPLIHTFLPHASLFGLFLDLDPQRFAASQQHSPSTLLTLALRRTSPALLYTICAFGARLSLSRTRDRGTEERFLSNALQSCAEVEDVNPQQPQAALQAIQAEVFLGYYFWHTGAFLRARVHAATAGALVTGLGLHQPAREAPPTQIQNQVEAPLERRLSPPTNALDAGERVRAVWAVLGLQQMLAVALEAPVDVCGQIDGGAEAPWPREIGDYLSAGYDWAEMTGTESGSTIRRYLSGQEPQPQTGDAGPSPSTVLAKAQLLLHRATLLHAQSTQPQQQQQQQAMASRYQTLSGLVETLRGQLPSREPRSRRSSSDFRMSHARRISSESACSQSQGSEYGYPNQVQATYSASTSTVNSPAYTNIPMPTSWDSMTDVDTELDPTISLVHALLDGAFLRLHEVFVRMFGDGADSGADERYLQTAMGLLQSASATPNATVVPTIFGVWSSFVVSKT
ncbi:Zn(2)-C6 fungal-type domain-containing protein [Mycena chlorophos]|uniref:Zn(2)-C6 fungal-type domain-containing protein n=1 Tax=Mycena chlorophos TaxID=658473 RepID=A0A8H6VVQ7_MYCCL|nr:Zn(2)-C6 fungal-type domain-containing protein [Mycena chlorophos]